MKIIGIIPARYASVRFPGKPLANIKGKTMIRRVYEQVVQSKLLSSVIVATDDERIKNEVIGFGGRVMMTSNKHRSGTERCNEVVQKLLEKGEKYELTVNIQGDEPFIDPSQIDKVISVFSNKNVRIATLIKKISASDELKNPNVVKVVIDKTGKAIYFSRWSIPFTRSAESSEWLNNTVYFKHIGIYAYKTRVLKKITALRPSPLEIAESLEQLRWIENGFNIFTEKIKTESISIDTPEDLLKIINI